MTNKPNNNNNSERITYLQASFTTTKLQDFVINNKNENCKKRFFYNN